MPFHIFLFIFLVSQIHKTAEVDCDQIKPKSAADCKLSENDKSGFIPKKLCCNEKDYLNSGFKCASYIGSSLLLKNDECYNETNIPTDCEFINPNSASDCVLSEKEKAKYDYCCYVVDDGVKYCSAETKESYEAAKEVFKVMGTKQDKFECKMEFIFPRLIYFLLILLNL